MDKIPPEQLEEYKEAFIMFDKDQSGFICSKELNAVLRSLGQNPTEEELQDMMNECDADGNGLLDFGEFVQLMEDQQKSDDVEIDLMNAFYMFDTDNKGYFETSELRDIYLNHLEDKIPEKELQDLFRFMKLDQDRRIRFAEFVNLVDPFNAFGEENGN